MKPRTAAERKQDERDRRRAEGWRLLHHWVHGADAAKVQRFIARLNKRRQR